jgi:hypothetical protein
MPQVPDTVTDYAWCSATHQTDQRACSPQMEKWTLVLQMGEDVSIRSSGRARRTQATRDSGDGEYPTHLLLVRLTIAGRTVAPSALAVNTTRS